MSEEMGRAEMQLEMQAVSQPRARSHALQISDYLTPDRIVPFPAGTPKEEVLRQLLARLPLPSPSQAMQAVWDRERTGSTRLRSGVAIPHARIQGLPGLLAALGVLPAGLADETDAANPTHLCLLFLGPAENVKEHLDFLAAISRLFQVPEFTASLAKLDNPNQILSQIREAELGATK
jgi:PTS system nitrogen regulatory IIA component